MKETNSYGDYYTSEVLFTIFKFKVWKCTYLKPVKITFYKIKHEKRRTNTTRIS